MPDNNRWRKEGEKILYKQQDYINSCFPACLQMALANFGLIGQVRIDQSYRPIEDTFYHFCSNEYGINIDRVSPTIKMVDRFMLNTVFCHTNRINVDVIRTIKETELNKILRKFNCSEKIALIGATKENGGHATMIIKHNRETFAINPQTKATPYFSRINNIDYWSDRNGEKFAIGSQFVCQCLMEYCYIVTAI